MFDSVRSTYWILMKIAEYIVDIWDNSVTIIRVSICMYLLSIDDFL